MEIARSTTPADVFGDVAPGFGPVADAFRADLADSDAGAACCIHVGGVPVVDIWGGVADPRTGAPYGRDTLQLLLTASQGAMALCAAMLVDRGQLDLDRPVATYWPTFGRHGKEHISVRWLLSHQAGLPMVDGPVSVSDLLAITPVAEALANQRPLWPPGSAHGHHALSVGWIVGELVRRLTGSTLGSYFAQHVAEPLGLDFWIGLPGSLEWRVAPLLPAIGSSPGPPARDGVHDLAWSALAIPGGRDATSVALFNNRGFHAAEIPAANGISTARALSRMYAATVGTVEGVRLLSPETTAAMRATQTVGLDAVLGLETAYGVGFMLDCPANRLLGPSSFGHPGAGGCLGFADEDRGIGFAYVTNKLGTDVCADRRALRVVEAVRACARAGAK